jgi:hypothetical protein
LKEREHKEDLDVDRKTLETVREQDGKAWIGFVRFRIQIGSRLL